MKFRRFFLYALVLILTGCEPGNPGDPDDPSSELLEIKLFVFRQNDNPGLGQDVSGAIGVDTIKAVLPNGTNVTGLKPSIQYSAASINPANNAVQNFSTPVVYTLTGQNGAIKRYVVDVDILTNSTKEIVGFSFNPQHNSFLNEKIQAVIRNDSILVEVPYGTPVNNMAPLVSFNGSAILPANTSPQNFTNPVTYTVTAQDGSVRKYIAVVTILEKETPGTVFINSSFVNNLGVAKIYAIDAVSGKLKWKYNTDKTVMAVSPVFYQGMLYTALNKTLFAFDTATRSVKWEFPAQQIIQSTPMLVNDVLYFNANDGFLYAVNSSDGQLVWKFKQDGVIDSLHSNFSSPTIVDGVLYTGSTNAYIYAIDAATGVLKWKTFDTYAMGAGISSSPCVANGKLYIGDEYRNILALNITDGSFAWVFPANGMISASPTVVNGVVYFGGRMNEVGALDAATGTLKWRFFTHAQVSCSPAVVDNTVYFGCDGPNNNNFYAVDAVSGTLKWVYTNDHGFYSSPVVANKTVFVGSYSSVLAFNAGNGQLKWKYRTDVTLEDMIASPCVVDETGKVYYSSISGTQQ